MANRPTLLLLLCLICWGPGCAFDVYNLPKEPTQLQPSMVKAQGFVMARDLEITPPGGFQRTIRGGTTWDLVGTCAQGDVYKSKDQVLTVEASHVHEAYLTVSHGKLVGFYLPAEKAHVPLGYETELPTKR
jgi:hypothetical protein